MLSPGSRSTGPTKNRSFSTWIDREMRSVGKRRNPSKVLAVPPNVAMTEPAGIFLMAKLPKPFDPRSRHSAFGVR